MLLLSESVALFSQGSEVLFFRNHYLHVVRDLRLAFIFAAGVARFKAYVNADLFADLSAVLSDSVMLARYG